MTIEEDSNSSDWSIIPRANDTLSDIEVISNPSSVEPHPIMEQQPRMLYSEVLMKPEPAFSESDIEFVPEPSSPADLLSSPSDLEFDDEEYMEEVMRSTEKEDPGEEEEEVGCTGEVPEVVLEVNLTLLSFTIIVGVSGMSGFLLGGIYSAVLTNTIPHEADLAEYPGSLPSFLYAEEGTCPNGDCPTQLYRIQQNMKHLKETMSHEVRSCTQELRDVENATVHCGDPSYLTQLQWESAELRTLLGEQHAAVAHYRTQASSAQTHNMLQVTSLRQALKGAQADLDQARKSLSSRCQEGGSAGFWRGLYERAVRDLDQAEQSAEALEQALDEVTEELEDTMEEQEEARSEAKRQGKSARHYRSLVGQYKSNIEELDLELTKSRAIQGSINRRMESVTKQLEISLESCSNATLLAEKRVFNAVKSAEYTQDLMTSEREDYSALRALHQQQETTIAELQEQRSTLVRKLGAGRGKLLTTKQTYAEQSAVSRVESTTKMGIMRRKVGKRRSDLEYVKNELEEVQALVERNEEEAVQVDKYLNQVKTRLRTLSQEFAIREAIYTQYISSVERSHEEQASLLKGELSNRTTELEDVWGLVEEKELDLILAHTVHKKLVKDCTWQLAKADGIREKKRYWKRVARGLKDERDEQQEALEKCQGKVDSLKKSKESKITALAEYKKTAEMLFGIIHETASNPQCAPHSGPVPDIFIPRGPPLPQLNLTSQITSSDEEVCINYQRHDSSCSRKVASLFPGANPSSLALLLNTDNYPKKVTSAIQKYWGQVDQLYRELNKKQEKEKGEYKKRGKGNKYGQKGDDERAEKGESGDDWYWKRHDRSEPHLSYPSLKGESVLHPRGPKKGRGAGDWYAVRSHGREEDRQRENRKEGGENRKEGGENRKQCACVRGPLPAPQRCGC